MDLQNNPRPYIEVFQRQGYSCGGSRNKGYSIGGSLLGSSTRGNYYTIPLDGTVPTPQKPKP